MAGSHPEIRLSALFVFKDAEHTFVFSCFAVVVLSTRTPLTTKFALERQHVKTRANGVAAM
jgi:hypothetical protein